MVVGDAQRTRCGAAAATRTRVRRTPASGDQPFAERFKERIRDIDGIVCVFGTLCHHVDKFHAKVEIVRVPASDRAVRARARGRASPSPRPRPKQTRALVHGTRHTLWPRHGPFCPMAHARAPCTVCTVRCALCTAYGAPVEQVDYSGVRLQRDSHRREPQPCRPA